MTDLGYLGQRLADLRAKAPIGDEYSYVLLFGIRYSSELDGLSIKELKVVAMNAGLSANYGTELRKMVKLSRFVVETQGVGAVRP